MKYQEGKQNAREQAINWQIIQSKESLFWSEILYWQNYFTKLGKKYGLLKEFRENGII